MSRPKILIMEDNTADIALLRMALDKQGQTYDLEILQDGAEALQFIREHKTGTREPDPCVILLDIWLPKHDGMEVLKALRRDPPLNHIQVVVWSSFANSEKAAAVEALGALYRTKPEKLSEFLDLGAELFAICKEGMLV